MAAKATDIIPQGHYCYSGWGEEIKLCPYWSKKDGVPEQESGHCSFLGYGDTDTQGSGILWDQVKECNINMPEDPQDEFPSIGAMLRALGHTLWSLLPDRCESDTCAGFGVRGNENVVDGVTLCDDCSLDYGDKRGWM